MADLQRLVVRLEAETARYQRDLDAARKKLSQFEKGTTASLDGIKRAFVALGGTAALTAFVKRTVDAGDRLDELKQKTGIAVESLSRFGYAASFSGIEVEALSDAMGKNAKFVAELEKGSKTAAASLAAIGLSTKEYLALSPDERILATAAAFEKYADGAGKSAVVTEQWGKSGADLIPFFNEGADGIRTLAEESDKLGQTWSQEDATAAAEFNDATQKLFVALAASLRPAVISLIGPLTELADLLLDNAKNARDADGDYSLLAEELKGIATNAILAYSGLKLVGQSVIGAGKTLWEVFTGDDEGRVDAIQQTLADVTKTMEDARAKLDALYAPTMPAVQSLIPKGERGGGKPEIHFGNTSGDSAAKAIQSQVEALQRQAATLGMTTEQQELYELATDGATTAQLAAAKTAIDSISAYDQMFEEIDAGVRFQENLNSTFEQYADVLLDVEPSVLQYSKAIDDLWELMDAGVISQDQMTAALKRYKDGLDGIKSASDFYGENIDRIKSSTSNLFSSLITDGKNWKDHLLSYIGQVADSFAKMAADMAAQAIFGGSGGKGGIDWGSILGKLFGAAAGGAAGASFNTSSFDTGGLSIGGSYTGTSLYNHTFAAGGLMPANQLSLVGERGPELVVSPRAMRVLNADDTEDVLGRRGGTVVNQNWSFPGASVDGFMASRRQIQRKERALLGVR